MISEFTLRLICGLSITWCLLPVPLVTSGFFRIQLLAALGLSILAWMALDDDIVHPAIQSIGILAAAAICFVGSVLWTLERRQGGMICCGLVTLLVWGLLIVRNISASGEAPAWLGVLNAAASGWLIGGFTGTMLLGHWYLTASAMSLAPFQRAIRLTFVSAVVRLAGVALGIALSGTAIRSSLWHDLTVWTVLRSVAGLIAPLVLAPLALQTLRYRNTQSATGVLFAAVVLVFIGEATALLLTRDLHWPF